MASAEHLRPGGGSEPEQPERSSSGADVVLSGHDRQRLLETIAAVAPTPETGRRWTRRLGLQPATLPAWQPHMNAEDWWDEVFQQFDLGRGDAPYRNLIAEIRRVYQSNPVAQDLQYRYIESAGAPASLDPVADTCHVVIPASTEEELIEATKALHDLGLEPSEVWCAQHQVSFAVNSNDVGAVRRTLRSAALDWLVVAPGQPDYVVRSIYVQVPDGSRLQAIDTPSGETVGNLVGDVLATHREAHQGPDAPSEDSGNVVVDNVAPNGKRVRIDANQTIHDAQIGEDAQLRAGAEARAGAVHPQVREDALHRVRHQIVGYAQSRPGMTVRANSATLPTDYELEFDEPSFGPPRAPGAQPVEIEHHRVLIQLMPDFPETHPLVFWQSPIFHPNIFPNYDSDVARSDPESRGLVCLGQLQDAWYPAMDFARVCQLIVDIAAYRNYEVFELVASDDGSPRMQVNYFDNQAAEWAWFHREVIAARNGTPVYEPVHDQPRGRRNVVHPVD